MREYPVTVPNVFRINSNAFDVDKFPKTLKVENGLVSPFHHPQHQQYVHQRTTAANGNDLSKTYHISSNHNSHSNNESHQSHSNTKNSSENRNNDDRRANASSAYSLLDAITNVVTTGNCSGTIYPVNEPNEANYTSDDKLFVATHQHQQQQQQQYASMAQDKLTTPLINSTIRHHSAGNHSRDHQFPSVNYKNSYLLWIGTPVAAR